MWKSEIFEREKNYCTALILAKKLLKQGVITKEDFNKIHTRFEQKYRPVITLL